MFDPSKILANLFVGACPKNTEDIKRLVRDYGVTAVLNAQTDSDMAYGGIPWNHLESYYREAGIEVRRVPVRDFDEEDLRRQLPECVEVLDELLRKGRSVYLHCNMGVNRSPSIVIAYLHWVLGWDLETATDHVRRRRYCDPYLDAIVLAGEDRSRKA
jgi:protein-tyrosine phosphatase